MSLNSRFLEPRYSDFSKVFNFFALNHLRAEGELSHKALRERVQQDFRKLKNRKIQGVLGKICAHGNFFAHMLYLARMGYVDVDRRQAPTAQERRSHKKYPVKYYTITSAGCKMRLMLEVKFAIDAAISGPEPH